MEEDGRDNDTEVEGLRVMDKVRWIGYGFALCVAHVVATGTVRAATHLAPPRIRSPVRFLTEGAGYNRGASLSR